MSDEQAPDPDDVLAAAAAELRAHVDPGWVRVRSTALDRVRDAVRPSPSVVGRHDGGDYVVAGSVLRSVLREAVGGIARARPVRISFATDDDGVLEVVAVQVAVDYGTVLGPLAGRVRAAVRAALVAALGVPGRRGRIDVAVVDVDR